MTASVEGTRHFSIFELRRCGALSPGAIRPWFWRSGRTGKITRMTVLKAAASEIQIAFRYANWWRKQFVPLVRTDCSYGGSRCWFGCACGRRVGLLFDAGAGFYCRRCLRLSYACQLETKRWRPIERAQRIRVTLGGSANVLEAFPPKPRYMNAGDTNAYGSRPCCCRPRVSEFWIALWSRG
jgi:hypothetical protein